MGDVAFTDDNLPHIFLGLLDLGTGRGGDWSPRPGDELISKRKCMMIFFKRIMPLITALCTILCLSGCSTETFISSTPSGAEISLDDRSIGTTPLSCKVTYKPGYYSKYVFKAVKDGYETEMQIFQEPTFYSGVSGTIPSEIHFDLKPERGELPVPDSKKTPELQK